MLSNQDIEKKLHSCFNIDINIIQEKIGKNVLRLETTCSPLFKSYFCISLNNNLSLRISDRFIAVNEYVNIRSILFNNPFKCICLFTRKQILTRIENIPSLNIRIIEEQVEGTSISLTVRLSPCNPIMFFVTKLNNGFVPDHSILFFNMHSAIIGYSENIKNLTIKETVMIA